MQGKITTWSGEAYKVASRRNVCWGWEHGHCMVLMTCFFYTYRKRRRGSQMGRSQTGELNGVDINLERSSRKVDTGLGTNVSSLGHTR
jgi:hypothetical protein